MDVARRFRKGATVARRDHQEFLAAVVEALEYIAENPRRELLHLMQDYPSAPPPGYRWVRWGPGRRRQVPWALAENTRGE
jgi:hypothetical protein